MSPRHFLRLADLSREELVALLDRADFHRQHRAATGHLRGKSVAIVLEKASTRTRVSFEVAVHELGGHAIVLSGAAR